MEYRDFLLEINVEELPAWYVREALRFMRHAFHREFESYRINPNKIAIEDLGARDRLIYYIGGIPLQQEKASQEVIGPPKRIAFDEKGNPTKQALGFAKNQDVRIGDLKIKKTPKGEYVAIEKKEKSRNAKDILQEIIPTVIKEIRFPKTMRWDDSGLRFARPIESVLALFGRENLDIKLGNVPQKKVGAVTPTQYLKRLKLINSDKRKRKIKCLILREIKKLGADQDISESLLEETTFMVNFPKVFVGEFDKKFLALPSDVLKASMAKYQRIFPVTKKRKLINRFVAVVENGPYRNIKAIKRNYEKILEARLKDSLFFFDEDTKEPLSVNISQLKDLIFQKDLGNMFEKIQRLQRLCSFICERLDIQGSLKNDIQRAAELSKVDLTTHMVGEFPSLQGVMGGEYALRSGEKKEVAMAIRAHYLPQGIDDNLPEGMASSVLAVADKIDNVVGFLGMGADTSGSFDPFGIRRNALGVIRIIKDNKRLRFRMDDAIQKTSELYGPKLKILPNQLKGQVVAYMKDRIEILMKDAMPADLPADLVTAILKSGPFDIFDIFERLKQLISVDKKSFFQAAKVVERTSNILKAAKKEKIDEADEKLFKEELEHKVWDAYLNSRDKIQELIDKEQYKEATREYARAFFSVLHNFFDKVLVNVEDKTLRLNRLAIMKAINRLYTERIADLAVLPQIVVK